MADGKTIKESTEMFSRRDLKKLIIPLMIEQTLALTVGMIDTVMVASVGESAVSGVSLVETINILLINLFAALATGGAIIAGQYLGKNERRNARHAAKQLIIATFYLSFIIMLFCIVLNAPILSLVFGKIDIDVMHHARIYFYLTALSYPFIGIYNACAALFRGMGNSKIAMVNALIMNLINVLGNSLFIYGLGLGVFGAALSTLLSRAIAAVTMLYMLRNRNLDIYVRKIRFRDFDMKMVKRILSVGIPNGLENSMFQIGKIILASLVAAFGTTQIAANAVGNSLAGIGVIPGFALGMAIMTVVAMCVGANEYEQAAQYIKYLMKIAYKYMVLLNILMLILLKPILWLFQLTEDTFQIAFELLVLHGFAAMLIWPVAFTLPNAFRAAGDLKFPMVISIISMWCFRIGLGYLFGLYYGMGVLGVWIAMIVDWIFRSAFFIWHWLSGKWKKGALV